MSDFAIYVGVLTATISSIVAIGTLYLLFIRKRDQALVKLEALVNSISKLRDLTSNSSNLLDNKLKKLVDHVDKGEGLNAAIQDQNEAIELFRSMALAAQTTRDEIHRALETMSEHKGRLPKQSVRDAFSKIDQFMVEHEKRLDRFEEIFKYIKGQVKDDSESEEISSVASSKGG